MSIEARIKKVENQVQALEPTERYNKLALWEQLLRTMSLEHLKLVVPELRQLWSGERSYSPTWPSPLTRHAAWLVMIATFYHRGYSYPAIPLQLPPEVAKIWADFPLDPHRELLPDMRCRQCGMALPVEKETQPGLGTRTVRYYFDSCPVCGGQVEFHHGSTWRPYSTDDQALETTLNHWI